MTRIARRFPTVRVVVTGLVSVLVLTGCTTAAVQTSPPPQASANPTGDGVLRIGTLMPLTGNFAFLGGAQAAAVAVAVSDINAAGGVNGKPVELLPADSADATSTTAEKSFADLVAKGADVIIGPTSSVIASRLLPKLVTAGVTMISPAATFPDLASATDSGLFFRTIPAFDAQGTALARAVSAKGPVKAGLVFVTDDLSKSLVEPFRAGISAAGSTLVASEAVAPDAKDVSAQVKAIVAAKPDVVVLSSAYSTFDLTKALITQLIAAGFSGSKLWLTTQNTGDYSQAFPAGTLNGVNGIIEGARADDAFVGRLKAVDGNLATFRYAPEAYDATILAALAATVARDDSGRAIAGAVGDVSRVGIKCTTYKECLTVDAAGDDMDYDGLSGEINFTSQGDLSGSTYGLYTFNSENKFVFSTTIVTR